MKKGTRKLLGIGALLGAAGLVVYGMRSGMAGLTINRRGLSGRVAQRREREKERARTFLSRVTGQQATDPYEQEVVMQVSGLAAGKAQEFRKVLHRQAQEGRASVATYGDLGVAQ
jgi:hypothetical protein